MPVLILALGVSIDFGSAFRDRTRAQNVLDAGLLAAAVAYQANGSIKEAEKAGRATVKEHQQPGQRYNVHFQFDTDGVTGEIASKTRTFFMKVFGQGKVDWTVNGAASFFRPPVLDYALAVDISSSMRNGGHMNVLRTALRAFADKAFESSGATDVSVTLVPFANSVAFPPEYMKWLDPASFKGSKPPAFYGCFYQEPRASLASLSTAELGRYLATPDIVASTGYRLCPEPGTQVSFYMDQESQVNTAVNSLSSYQGTATAVGLSWAWRVLDPSWSPEFAKSNIYPKAYSQDHKKVIILFTDGKPFAKPWSNAKVSARKRREAIAGALADFEEVCKAIQADGRINLFVIGYGDKLAGNDEAFLKKCTAGEGKFYHADSLTLSNVLKQIAAASAKIALTR